LVSIVTITVPLPITAPKAIASTPAARVHQERTLVLLAAALLEGDTSPAEATHLLSTNVAANPAYS
jgi:hypothetical protein